MNTITIAGAIASQTGITLYLSNGAEMNLPNDSWKTSLIMERASPALAKGEQININLDEFSIEKHIEDKTAGVIRFIRKTMAELQAMLEDLEGSTKAEDPAPAKTSVPSVPVNPVPQPMSQKGEERQLVAVVKTDKGDVPIPGVSQMEKHFEHAAKTGNTVGLTRFMERLAGIIQKRGHTVQELLNFMNRADLPIADDGSIVAYKVLRSKDDKGTFVDCHTGLVTQRLGSRVSMDEALVDPSRRQECSTGLHIARRGYLSRFGGDIITLVKIAPEDVIAVPQGEPDKMRVAAYHIVNVLPAETHHVLRSNNPMTGDTVAARMLADAISGNHIGIVEEVRIGGPEGTDLKITPVGGSMTKAPKMGTQKAQALDDPESKLTPKKIREMAQAPAHGSTKEVPIAGETKAQRDARKKREKRAAEKAALEAASKPKKPVVFEAPKASPANLAEPIRPGETKAERDARRKREKRAAEKAAKGG